ncbi:glycosyltransferase family 4 protein [archaeon]|nr:glycosyltransferase family 4 protein [archaeon]
MKYKIIVVGPYPPLIGGITTFLELQIKSDLKKKYSLIKNTTTRTIKNADTKKFHVKVRYYFFDFFLTIWNFINFSQKVIFNNPKIIHMHTSSFFPFWETGIYLLFSKIFKKKFLIHLHGGKFLEFYKKSKYKSLIQFILNSADGLIVLSDYWIKNIKKISQNKNIEILKNPVNVEKISIKNENERNEEEEILFVGNNWKLKGVYDLIATMPTIIKNNPNIHLNLIGKEEPEAKKIILDKKMSKYVSCLGEITGDKKWDYYKKATIFVLPSHYESFGIVLLEAMASGVPIIASKTGGIPDLIEDGKNGLLFEPRNLKDLSGKIIKLLNDKKLSQIIIKNNLLKVKKNYSTRKVFNELDNIYQRYL